MLEAGYPEVLASGIAEHMARSRHGGVTAAVLPDLEKLFGRNPGGVEAFFGDQATEFEFAEAEQAA
jgi:hypothetical protein